MARISRLAAVLLLLCAVPAHSAPSATDKLIKSAERNLAALTRWSSTVSGSEAMQLSDERAGRHSIGSTPKHSDRCVL